MAIQSGDGRVPDDRGGSPRQRGRPFTKHLTARRAWTCASTARRVRLTQRQKAEVFQTSTANIDLHLKTFSRTMS